MDEQQLIETDIESYLVLHQEKLLLRFVTVGSVDDGKSTLIGRLLHDTHGIYEDQLSAVKRASAKGNVEIDFSLFTDGLKAEREQGITIDVAYRYFSTEKRKFIIADTPGHVQYTRNMATGASTADVAIILIDARLGVLTQSRRHAYIASLLGIPHLAVCINKMDLVAWSEARFSEICAEFSAFAASLGFSGLHFFPISALLGDNIVHPSANTPWHERGTLLGFLETVEPTAARPDAPLRYPVQYVIRPNLDYRGFAAQIAAGTVRKGDRVVALPSRKTSTVVAVDSFEGELTSAHAPMSVTVRLADEIDLSRGDLLVREGELPRVTQRFQAMLVWMNERALDTGKSYLLKHTTRVTRAEVERVEGQLDLETLTEHATDGLALNDIGRVTITTHRPLFVDAYRSERATGAFILIDSLSNNTVAAGMILAEEPGGASDKAGVSDGRRSQVSARERAERLGQRGGVVLVTGPSAADSARIAYALERLLFDRGKVALVVDPADRGASPSSALPAYAAELARRTADAGLVAIFAHSAPTIAERDAVRAAVGDERVVEVRGPGGGEVGEGALSVEGDAEVAAQQVAAELERRGLV